MINICKECGQEFEASSARIKYCSRVHYRPCPICGEPVEAKYLSDPPRKCNKCRKGPTSADVTTRKLFTLPTLEKLVKVPKPEPEIKPVVETVKITKNIPEDSFQYVGKSICGFIHGHRYRIEVNKKDHYYWVTSLEDVTTGITQENVLIYSSKISLDQKFKK